jgi:3-phenylpropionate/trans-cinnamate dioxygenase ferredoxin reductase subunit
VSDVADRHVDVLLIGGGPASHACAGELRAQGFEGEVLLVGRELDPSYERPPCSKEYLRGTRTREELLLAPVEGVEVLTRTSVLKLDAAAKTAKLSTKQEVSYGQALIATGANVRRLPVDGAQLEGIHYLRAPGNADAIRADAQAAAGGEAVVVGGSYLGTEVAAALTDMGLRVTILMQEAVPLERAYGRRTGAWFGEQLTERGVRLVGGDALEAFEGDGDRVRAVRTASGAELRAQLVVVAAGAVPDVMLARGAGLEIGPLGGVQCDSALRVVGAEGLWAAGDMCEWHSDLHGGPARVEHWEVAAGHGRAVAAGMTGTPAPYVDVPYFWSDIGDWVTSEYVGIAGAAGWEEEVVRGSYESGAFSVWQLRSGRLVGTLSVGRPEDLDEARRLIASGEAVEPAALAAG